jgi:hypothetical protein
VSSSYTEPPTTEEKKVKIGRKPADNYLVTRSKQTNKTLQDSLGFQERIIFNTFGS